MRERRKSAKKIVLHQIVCSGLRCKRWRRTQMREIARFCATIAASQCIFKVVSSIPSCKRKCSFAVSDIIDKVTLSLQKRQADEIPRSSFDVTLVSEAFRKPVKTTLSTLIQSHSRAVKAVSVDLLAAQASDEPPRMELTREGPRRAIRILPGGDSTRVTSYAAIYVMGTWTSLTIFIGLDAARIPTTPANSKSASFRASRTAVCADSVPTSASAASIMPPHALIQAASCGIAVTVGQTLPLPLFMVCRTMRSDVTHIFFRHNRIVVTPDGAWYHQLISTTLARLPASSFLTDILAPQPGALEIITPTSGDSQGRFVKFLPKDSDAFAN